MRCDCLATGADETSLIIRSDFVTRTGAVQAGLDRLLSNLLQECLKWPHGHRAPGRTWAGLVQALILEFPQDWSGGWNQARAPVRMVREQSTAASALPEAPDLLSSLPDTNMLGPTDTACSSHLLMQSSRHPAASMQLPGVRDQDLQCRSSERLLL